MIKIALIKLIYFILIYFEMKRNQEV